METKFVFGDEISFDIIDGEDERDALSYTFEEDNFVDEALKGFDPSGNEVDTPDSPDIDGGDNVDSVDNDDEDDPGNTDRVDDDDGSDPVD